MTKAGRQMKQQPIWTGAGVVFRTVRHITEWDGRTVGVVRNNYGAEGVVQLTGSGRWDYLEGVHVWDIRGER